ncbi:uncharacterized protein [Haliotis cracherodii]|uniref:uncharacterized protein n=1 Tax=Haliotis cracherodii TaxID=6455 RepID=UPI0039E7517A
MASTGPSVDIAAMAIVGTTAVIPLLLVQHLAQMDVKTASGLMAVWKDARRDIGDRIVKMHVANGVTKMSVIKRPGVVQKGVVVDIQGTRSNGRCEYGCVDGNYGLDCNQVCSELCKSGRCQREDGACLKGTSGKSTPKPSLDATVSANVYLILASVGVFLLCVVAAGILMIRFCRSPCLNSLNRNNPPPSGRSLPDPPPLQTSKNMYSVIYEDQMDPSAQSLRSNTLTPPSRTPGLDRPNSLPLSKDDPEEDVFSTSGEVLQMRSLCDTTPSEEPELHSLCASPDPDGSTYESLSSSAPGHKQTTVPRPYITPVTDDQPEQS